MPKAGRWCYNTGLDAHSDSCCVREAVGWWGFTVQLLEGDTPELECNITQECIFRIQNLSISNIAKECILTNGPINIKVFHKRITIINVYREQIFKGLKTI